MAQLQKDEKQPITGVGAESLLSQLESANSPSERRRLSQLLLQEVPPEVLVVAAFAEYDRTGREVFLLHAVSLLASCGEAAWPALLWVARSGRSEAELFLGTMARCPGVTEGQRAEAFRLLATHSPSEVRLGLLEHRPVSLAPALEPGGRRHSSSK